MTPSLYNEIAQWACIGTLFFITFKQAKFIDTVWAAVFGKRTVQYDWRDACSIDGSAIGDAE